MEASLFVPIVHFLCVAVKSKYLFLGLNLSSIRSLSTVYILVSQSWEEGMKCKELDKERNGGKIMSQQKIIYMNCHTKKMVKSGQVDSPFIDLGLT